jgi:hypothetical protein
VKRAEAEEVMTNPPVPCVLRPSDFGREEATPSPSVIDRESLIASIATIIEDYGTPERAPLDAQHVQRWADQLSAGVQPGVLQELEHVLRKTYLRRSLVGDLLDGLIVHEAFSASGSKQFWASANLLDLQTESTSQKRMLGLLDERLQAVHSLQAAECGTPEGPFVYLDDAIFTGSRVRKDLGRWIASTAPAEAIVYVVVLAAHTSAWNLANGLRAHAEAEGKRICVRVISYRTFENRLAYRNTAEVLWHTRLPSGTELAAYLESRNYPFEPRERVVDAGEHSIFSSEKGRAVLERALLGVGWKLIQDHSLRADYWRPLGFGSYGLGFGTTLVSFLNCPNTAPLALWWGEDIRRAGRRNAWYPLFPRRLAEGRVVSGDRRRRAASMLHGST